MVSRFELAVFDTASFEHANGGFGVNIVTSVVEVMHVDNLFNAGLDEGFSAFNTGEVINVKTSTLKFAHVTTEVQDGVEFGVTNVRIFCIVFVGGFTIPGEIVVAEIIRRAIIADG